MIKKNLSDCIFLTKAGVASGSFFIPFIIVLSLIPSYGIIERVGRGGGGEGIDHNYEIIYKEFGGIPLFLSITLTLLGILIFVGILMLVFTIISANIVCLLDAIHRRFIGGQTNIYTSIVTHFLALLFTFVIALIPTVLMLKN
jgi:hypothetical protein